MGMPVEQAARTVRYTMEAGEAVRAGRLVNRQLFRLMAVVPVIPFGVGLVVLLTLGWPDGAVFVIAIWAMALLLAGLDLAMPAISARQAARRYPDLFVGETVVSLDGAGLHARKGETEGHRGWSAMTDFIENAEFVVIRQGQRAVAVIPKRAFVDAADVDSFLTVLRRHLVARTSGT
jgi:hypothetical protein